MESPRSARNPAAGPPVFLAAAVVCALWGCGGAEHDQHPWASAPQSVTQSPDAGPSEFPVPPPPFSKKTIFPCTDCHNPQDMELDTERRELMTHEQVKLNHGPRERWCFDCHNPEGRNSLRLAGDVLVPFSESYRLCGQCHGDKYRDWKAGIHGKRTGSWNGAKQYLLCAHCHDPHSPHFKPLKPLPPPPRPVAH